MVDIYGGIQRDDAEDGKVRVKGGVDMSFSWISYFSISNKHIYLLM